MCSGGSRLEPLKKEVERVIPKLSLTDELGGDWWSHTVIERRQSQVSIKVYPHTQYREEFETPWDWSQAKVDLDDDDYSDVLENPQDRWPSYVDHLDAELVRDAAAELRAAGFDATMHSSGPRNMEITVHEHIPV